MAKTKSKAAVPAQTIHLQGIYGQVPAVKASELKPGDITVWNGGETEKIIGVTTSKSGKTIQAAIEYTNFMTGKKTRSIRRFSSDRLVGIEKPKSTADKNPVVQSKAAVPAAKAVPSAPTFTVMVGRKSKTFATKAEAKAYEKQCRKKTGKKYEIRESKKKPSHKVVSFTAKSK